MQQYNHTPVTDYDFQRQDPRGVTIRVEDRTAGKVLSKDAVAKIRQAVKEIKKEKN